MKEVIELSKSDLNRIVESEGRVLLLKSTMGDTHDLMLGLIEYEFDSIDDDVCDEFNYEGAKLDYVDDVVFGASFEYLRSFDSYRNLKGFELNELHKVVSRYMKRNFKIFIIDHYNSVIESC